MEIVIRSLAEAKQLAEKLSRHINGNFIILLEGDLGAGKTTFTKMLGKALKEEAIINSPTFTILKQYDKLNHIDAYRLEGIYQDLGFEEVFEEEKLCVIEWAQFIQEVLPKQFLSIQILLENDENRIFKLTAKGIKYEKVLEDF